MESVIKIKKLTKNYGKNIGVENVDFEIKKGDVFGFIGPNGAGKSTTIRCIMDFVNKTFGEIFINGKLIQRNNTNIKSKIGYLPSEIHLYDDLTVKQMIEYSNRFYLEDCMPKANDLIQRLELDEKKKINELSLGNLKKVGIVLCLMHNPDIIIMDEPTSGLDPLMQEVFYELIDEEIKKGKTILFSSHILREIKRICNRVAIIKNGKVIKIDDINNFNNSNLFRIEIESKDINQIKEVLKLTDIKEKQNEIEFIYSDINELIKVLSNYNLDKLIINELDIEETFIHYYKD